MKVLTFGGAALADEFSLSEAARLASRSAPGPIVCSASTDITDQLAALARTERPEDREALGQLLDQQMDLIRSLPSRSHQRVAGELRSLFQELVQLLGSRTRLDRGDPHATASAISMGERLMARILSGHLRARGVDARPLDAGQVGIVTDGTPGNARILMRPTSANLEANLGPLVEDGCQPVLPGCYGVDTSGRVTLLGRGGSDYTASAVGASLGASVVELWKRGKGVFTVDPELHGGGRWVPMMSYRQADTVAKLSARLLHPRTIEPLEGTEATLHIRCFNSPAGPGTRVVPSPSRRAQRTVLTADHGLWLLRASHGQEALERSADPSPTGNIAGATPPDRCVRSPAGRAYLLRQPPAGAEGASDAERGHAGRHQPGEARCVAVIHVVHPDPPGERDRTIPWLQVLGREGLDVEMLLCGIDDRATHIVVPADQLTPALDAVLAELPNGSGRGDLRAATRHPPQTRNGGTGPRHGSDR